MISIATAVLTEAKKGGGANALQYFFYLGKIFLAAELKKCK